MPGRNKHIDNLLPYLYQRQTFDTLSFGFIRGMRIVYPSITLKEAAIAFMKEFNVCEDLHNVSSVIVTYERVLKDYYEAEKAKNRKNNAQSESL